MVTTRLGTTTTSCVTATETPQGAPPRGKKRTAKRANKGLEVSQHDNEGEGPPKKKVKLELPEKTDYEGQQAENENESNNTGQYDHGH